MPYSGNPGDSTADLVRFLAGDTSAVEVFLTDDEIDFLVAERTVDAVERPYSAAAAAARRIAAKLAREYDGTSGDVQKAKGKRAEEYRTLAAELAAEATQRGEGSDDQSAPLGLGLVTDAEPTKPYFWVGMHDNVPGSSVVEEVG